MNWTRVRGQRGREGGATAGDRLTRSPGWLGTGCPARESRHHAVAAAATGASTWDPEGRCAFKGLGPEPNRVPWGAGPGRDGRR